MSCTQSMRLSASLLSAIFIRPSSQAASTAAVSQTRLSSGITRLTKLHRRQKVALREERAQSALRAPFVAPPQAESLSSGEEVLSTASNLAAYHVARTPSSNLPVYTMAKNGGTKHITLIRKISGDLMAFKDDLLAALPPITASGRKGAISGEAGGLFRQAVLKAERTGKKGKDAEQVTINFTTGNVVVRGWRKEEVDKFLSDRGF